MIDSNSTYAVSRRRFLGTAGAIAAGGLTAAALAGCTPSTGSKASWSPPHAVRLRRNAPQHGVVGRRDLGQQRIAVQRLLELLLEF